MNPGKTGVDFRAACFCHRKVVDLGFVCSVCLSSGFFLPFQFGTMGGLDVGFTDVNCF